MQLIRRQYHLIIASLVLLSVPPLGAGEPAIRIVTTTSDLASIAREVAGDLADVQALCTGKEDPHFVQARPGLILAARKADLWIRIGMDLEIGWEGPVLDGSHNPAIREGQRGHLDASADVLRLEVPTQKVSREFGDVHPQGNPHYWLDPYNGRVVARTIADRLAVLFPAKAAQFQANLQRFQRALDERMFGQDLVGQVDPNDLWHHQIDGTLDTFLPDKGKAQALGGWVAAMRPLRGQKIVTYHRSWVYFAHRFGLEVAAELEPKPGIPPSAGHLAKVTDLVRQLQIKQILQEPFYSPKAGRRVAEQTGANLVIVANSVGGEKEATDYLALMDLIVRRITENSTGARP